MTNVQFIVTVATSAFAGGLLDRLLDARHRHDDVRRDHYVTTLLAMDDLFQSLLDAVDANNRRAHEPEEEITPERAAVIRGAETHALGALTATSPAFHEARRAYQVVGLFAPPRVMEPLNDMWIPLTLIYKSVHAATVDAQRLPVPEYPQEAAHRYRNAVRRDLGMRELKLFDNPAQDEGPQTN